MDYQESLKYLEANLDNLVETKGRISKMPKLEGKCYINPLDMEVILNALTSMSNKPKHKSRVIAIALNIRTCIDKEYSPFV